MTRAQMAVIEAAFGWWKSHRPVGRDLRWHLDNPTINTCSSYDAALAEAVANAIKPLKPKRRKKA